MDELELRQVVFSKHSLGRFASRFERLEHAVLCDPEKTARKLLSHASENEAINPVERVRRIIKNNFAAARYFVESGWRFIIVGEGDKLTVVTIERVKRDA